MSSGKSELKKTDMLLIYIEKKSPRLEYILQTLFNSVGLTDWETCFDKHHFYNASESGYINYSSQRIRSDEIFIQPHNLLFETEIQKQLIDIGIWNEYPTFFQSNSDLSFDLFAASFYLIARYEEYLPFKADKFHRFPHTASLAYKKDFIHLPLVNIWMKMFVKMLGSKFTELQFAPSPFHFTPTYDIDIAYRFKRSKLSNIGSLIHRCLLFDAKDLKDQIHYFFYKGQDTYDVYDWLDVLHEEMNLQPVYFFLVADKRSALDNNIPLRSLAPLIHKTIASGKIGLHPSTTASDFERLVKEKKNIESVITTSISKSRQHYIKLQFPKTYRDILAAGIQEDYSMGYSTVNGFRASFAHSFLWFNLHKNETTQLRIFPFCFMDGCSFVNQKQSAAEGFAELTALYKSVKEVNGHFITVFHNTLLTEEKRKIEFRHGYEKFLRAIKI